MALASSIKPAPGNALLDRVTALDRSSDAFPLQLAEAHGILGTKLRKPSHLNERAKVIDPGATSKYGPKEEWTLRWLLKRLNVDEIQLGSPPLHSDAWELLKHLVHCCPTSVAAKLLKTHDFVLVLKRTLSWLCQDGFFGDSSHVRPVKDSGGCGVEAESNSLPSSVPLPDRTQKKRKRGSDMPAMAAPEAADAELFYSICGVISEVRTKAETVSGTGFGDFAAENLKFAARTTPEIASEILAEALNIAGKVEIRHQSSMDLMVLPFTWIWNSRMSVLDDQTEQMEMAFSAKCLVPALRILGMSLTKDKNLFRVQLETLLVTHCILPARDAFLQRRAPKERTPDAVNSRLQKYTASLSQTSVSDDSSDFVSRSSYSGEVLSHPLQVLYEIAANAIPRLSMPQRTIEAPWLQVVFNHLLLFASFDLFKPSESKITAGNRQLLREMLMISKSHNISLDREHLETVAMRFAGLSSSSTMVVDWLIVGFCIDLDPNIVALTPSTGSESVVSRLVDRLRECAYKGSRLFKASTEQLDLFPVSETNAGDYEAACRHVVFPFVKVQVQNRSMVQFMSCWKDQLESCEATEYSPDLEGNWSQCIWEDRRLIALVSSKLEDALTDDQVLRIFQNLPTALEPAKQQDKKLLAKLRATAIISKCILNGLRRSSCIEALESTASEMRIAFGEAIMQGYDDSLTNVSWALESSISQHWPKSFLSKDPLVDVAHRTILDGFDSEQNSTRPIVFELAFCAFDYLLIRLCSSSGFAGNDDVINSIIAKLVHRMAESKLKPDKRAPKLELHEQWWAGTQQEIDCRTRLVLACSTVLVLDSVAITTLSSDSIQSLVDQLYDLALLQTNARLKQSKKAGEKLSGTSPVLRGEYFSWVSLWDNLSRSVAMEKIPTINDSLRRKQQQTFINACDGSRDKNFSFALSSVQYSMIGSWTRDQRVALENALTSRIIARRTTDPQIRLQMLSMLLILVETPTKLMNLIKDPVNLSWIIFKSYSDDSASYLQTSVPLLRRLLKRAFGNTVSQPRLVPVAEEVLQRISKTLKSGLKSGCSLAALTWVCSSLQLLEDHDAEALQEIRKMQEKAFETILRALATPDKLPVHDSDSRTAFLIDHLLFLKSYICTIPAGSVFMSTSSDDQGPTEEIWPFLEQLALKMNLKAAEFRAEGLDELSRCDKRTLDKLKIVLSYAGKADQSGLQTLEDEISLKNCPSVRYAFEQVKSIRRRFARLSIDQKAKYIQGLIPEKHWAPNDSDLYLIGKLTGTSYSHEDRSDSLRTALSRTITLTMALVIDTKSLELCQLALRILDIALRKNPWIVSQYHIDTALATVSVMTSKSSVKLPRDESHNIYTCLCNLVGSILAVHRVKTGGRHHLLVAALQGLLSCLFVPYEASARSRISVPISHPSWLDGTNAPLLPVHAAALTRLITSICDPSASAVKRSRNRERLELNDATKRARITAGQHMQYVLMEFCQLQLRGQLAPEVRSALNPGLFAIFDSMGQEVRRTVNAALDPQGRAMFRAVYDDWRRFGKWEGS